MFYYFVWRFSQNITNYTCYLTKIGIVSICMFINDGIRYKLVRDDKELFIRYITSVSHLRKLLINYWW